MNDLHVRRVVEIDCAYTAGGLAPTIEEEDGFGARKRPFTEKYLGVESPRGPRTSRESQAP